MISPFKTNGQYFRTVLIFLIYIVLVISATVFTEAQETQVTVKSDASGTTLQVNGKDFMIIGMNWDYYPIGKNYTYSLWSQPDNVIQTALDNEMPLLKNMGVNAIRQYVGIPPRWIKYIYERYGIYTVLNHTFGRYGVSIDGMYMPNTDYSDPRIREYLVREVDSMVNDFRATPGLLMWLLGNENNYGLFWGGAATEDIPVGETLESMRARQMYSLFNDAIKTIKQKDTKHPVAIANGDLLFIDIIAKEIQGLDIFGTNMYRGISFRDAFQTVKEKLNIPIMFTEFGADAFNEKDMCEDQISQARYLLGNWQEIFEQSSGKGKIGNAIGGFTFQFSDGWWKYRQEINLDVHDVNASWSNGGYKEDYSEGENNMNEEWFGICAKGPSDGNGYYQLYPRASFYALKRAYRLDIYNTATDTIRIRNHFNSINLVEDVLTARGDRASLQTEEIKKVRISGLRMEFETYNTGGERITTPADRIPGGTSTPAFLGFDHLESFYAEVEARPSENITGKVSVNILGHVPENPIDEIFYENRGLPRTVVTGSGTSQMNDLERVKIFNASILWDSRWLMLDGFYRTGHYHWGYEGDFFGLYPEANYGDNINLYNADAPLGFEVTGKKLFDGLKVAFGPQLWWGANPTVLVKYQRSFGPIQATGMYQEDIDKQSTAVSSFAVPLAPTRKGTLHLAYKKGELGIEVGGIWSGSTKVGQQFQIATGTSGNYTIYQDHIKSSDAFGGKVKLTFSSGRWNWYAQGSVMGLVADGGPTSTLTYTGWRLKDCGMGNQRSFLTGLAVLFGNWQIAPNFLWQKPIEAPIPNDIPAPGRPRNILADPFAVRGNRETVAGELLINYDPTPATWLYMWDNDLREDASFAFSTGIVVRHQPTTQDASIGILKDGRTLFAFPGATPARDVWEVNSRFISKMQSGVGIIANTYFGTVEPNGSDVRLIHRYGGNVRCVYNSMKFIASAKVNDWGPYDYHRDFNLTYPLQFSADISTVFGTPEWFDIPQTRIGIIGTWRSLDRYSARYDFIKILDATGNLVPNTETPGQPIGNEWEIRTYIHLNVGM
ncbi:MAG: glycosidase [Ignavibacteriae bacterium]|nr:glycosidase [Ignavibacteriota bacterium]